MQTTSIPSQRTLEFGIYRDGDNNLDASQAAVLRQALDVSAKDSHIAFTVQDTTSRFSDDLKTNQYQIADGAVSDAHVDAPHETRNRFAIRLISRNAGIAGRDDLRMTGTKVRDRGGRRRVPAGTDRDAVGAAMDLDMGNRQRRGEHERRGRSEAGRRRPR